MSPWLNQAEDIESINVFLCKGADWSQSEWKWIPFVLPGRFILTNETRPTLHIRHFRLLARLLLVQIASRILNCLLVTTKPFRSVATTPSL
jgi:hypothetical protein